MSEEEIKTMALKMQSALLESSYQMYQKLEQENQQLKSVLKEIRELLLNFNNGVCVIDGKEKPAFTKALNFDETRELLWSLLEIIDKGIGEDK